MLFQVLCGFEPIFYTTHPNEESKKKEIMTDQLPDIEDENPKNIEIRIDIERALEQLPEEIKEIVILFFFQGLKQKEIADLLNIKLSLVKYRVSKAKELLAKQLEVEKL